MKTNYLKRKCTLYGELHLNLITKKFTSQFRRNQNLMQLSYSHNRNQIGCQSFEGKIMRVYIVSYEHIAMYY